MRPCKSIRESDGLLRSVPQAGVGSLMMATSLVTKEQTSLEAARGMGDTDVAYHERRLLRALEVACTEEFVGDLDARLGESGPGSSEGQTQCLAVARAVFADRPVPLSDESGSASDETTERRLTHSLYAMTAQAAVIVVTAGLRLISATACHASGMRASRMRRVEQRFAAALELQQGPDTPTMADRSQRTPV